MEGEETSEEKEGETEVEKEKSVKIENLKDIGKVMPEKLIQEKYEKEITELKQIIQELKKTIENTKVSTERKDSKKEVENEDLFSKEKKFEEGKTQRR